MEDDPRTAPLKRWNKLARENAENAIVSSMFVAASKSSQPLEQFTTWLLVGTAVVASFLIANADQILPLISEKGFQVCGAFLCLSCIFGLVSKIYALRCRIGIEISEAVRGTLQEHLNEYEKEEDKINESADFWGISLDTDIRIDRVLSEFYKPLPKLAVWLAKRMQKKYEGDPQIGYIPLIIMLNRQGLFTIMQALLFLGFLVSGFIYASAI